MLHSILLVQIMCLAIFLHNLCPSPLWSTSWPRAIHFIHFCTQSVSSFRNTCPYYHNLFCLSSMIISSISNLSLNSVLGTLSFTLPSHIRLAILNYKFGILSPVCLFSSYRTSVMMIMIHLHLRSPYAVMHATTTV